MNITSISNGESGLSVRTKLNTLIPSVNSFTDAGGALAIIDDIMDWDGTTLSYKPYTTQQAFLSFDTSTTAPTLTTRVNINGTVHAKALLAYDPSYITVTGNYNALYCASTGATQYAIRANNGVEAYSSVDGKYALLVTNNLTGSGSGNRTLSMMHINRNATGLVDITGNIIDITDNPTASGVVLGKVLSATIGTTERISFNPRAATSGTAYIFDTDSVLTSSGKLVSFRNNTFGELVSINGDGLLQVDGGIRAGNYSAGYYTRINELQSTVEILDANVIVTGFYPAVETSGTAVAYLFDTSDNLTTTGAKLLSIRNAGTEKASIDKDGSIEGGGINFKITAEGGYAIKLIAGENLYKGEVVYLPIGGAANSTVLKAPVSNDMPIGIVYADAASAASVWIVVSGMTDVLPMTSITAARGNIIFVSATEAGRVDQTSTTPTTEHWRECGHFLNTGSGAGVLARAVIHFN